MRKKNKEQLKGFVSGVVVTALMVGIMPTASAAVQQLSIPVSYNNIQIVVDGEKLATDKEPFIYEGTTYLPVRAVAQATGKDVTWDNASQTIYLGTVPKNVTSIETAMPQMNYSRKNPAPVGTSQTIKIEDYSKSYTATVTVLSTERGASAWEKIKAANSYNDAAPEGQEYILAKIKVAVNNVKDDAAVSVWGYSMFDAFTQNDEEYRKVSVVKPEPELEADIYSGASTEGYVVFCVNKSDKNPKIVFGRDYTGANGIWFKL